MRFFDSFGWWDSERRWQWGFLFDGSGARIFRVVEALVLVMLGSYQMAIGATVEGTIPFEMSEVIA